MTALPATDWAEEYAALARRLPCLAQSARLTLCAFSACVDRLCDLHELAPRLLAHPDPRAVAFGLELRRRAASGLGGEISVDWPEGPAWLEPLARTSSLGGTAAQAAQALALLDAPALLALADRSPAQLALIDGRVLVAEGGNVVPLAACRAGEASGKVPHFIFEYTEGRDVAGATPPRSTRVIVRFAEEDMDYDPAFAAVSVPLAASAGAGIVDGFNELAPERFDAAAARAMAVVDRWRAAGLDVVHAELGDYSEPRNRQATLAALSGRVTSIGMNRREPERAGAARGAGGRAGAGGGRGSAGGSGLHPRRRLGALCHPRRSAPGAARLDGRLPAGGDAGGRGRARGAHRAARGRALREPAGADDHGQGLARRDLRLALSCPTAQHHRAGRHLPCRHAAGARPESVISHQSSVVSRQGSEESGPECGRLARIASDQ